MEQMYLIEIFIDKVYIFASDENEGSGANKNLIIKIRFGPKVQFIVKEEQLALNGERRDDIIECDENGRRKWCRTIRIGKSYLFPSYPDTVLMILDKFPLELEVWNDDENEEPIFVGVGTMQWDPQFYHMLKETADASPIHTPLSIKTITTLMAECCCKPAGEVSFILRLSSLGGSIMTEFQQLMQDPDSFVFRTDKAPSMFQCKRVEGDDKNFCMVGSLYETTTLEDPTIQHLAHQKIEICTELENCGKTGGSAGVCQHTKKEEQPKKKKYPIDKIRMGDIHGPCGNSNCPLAHRVRNYIRTLEAYKKKPLVKLQKQKMETLQKRFAEVVFVKTTDIIVVNAQKIKKKDEKVVCSGCGGVVSVKDTCEDRKNNLFGTGATPRASKTQVAYVFSVHHVPNYNESIFGRSFIEENLTKDFPEYTPLPINDTSTSKPVTCYCRKPCFTKVSLNHVSCGPDTCLPLSTQTTRCVGTNNTAVYNVDVNKEVYGKPSPSANYQQCLQITDEKDCKCEPPKPSPPCRTFDCDCIAEIGNIASRKAHKPYCPLYKHKSSCPVTMMNEEEENHEDDEDVAEPLPYGLPPIQLGPCPIMGRPCSVPDGFARMYRNACQPTLPPSYDDAGKVCCSKEYERIKKALKNYMRYEKENDHRCINKFNVDTERRCCDKEQRLLSLMGKSCCGSHKMAIQEKYKDDTKK